MSTETLSSSSTNDINILLLGQTGAGKTTFINAFANYLVYNKLEEALEDEMQVIIPASFTFTNPDTFEQKTITIGIPSEYENANDEGKSSTQECRAFVFPTGNRLLRLIDAPGIGDTRGIAEDEKNFEKILTFISQYEHLNGICIMLKSDEQRLTLTFRFCIKELLHHLHVNAKQNIMFVFTSARSTQYIPGSSISMLRTLLRELKEKANIDVPISRDNSFLFDNESFRFLAVAKNGFTFTSEQRLDYIKSWDVSIKEFARLISSIIKCKLHVVRDTVSLNEVQQTIRKLSRPIGEISRLIQENIQLAEQYRQRIVDDPSVEIGQMSQKEGRYFALSEPRTVCISNECTRIVTVDGQQEVDYATICHENCYLAGVEEELTINPKLKKCVAIDEKTGVCYKCGCDWSKHLHITYVYSRHIIQVPIDITSPNEIEAFNTPTRQSALTIIDNSIANLRKEEKEIVQICAELSQFLRTHAITPYNDDIIEYIHHFIREEQEKQNAGANNDEVIHRLENMVAEYRHLMDVSKQAMEDQRTKETVDSTGKCQTDEVFQLIDILYNLPLNGFRIREQVEGLRNSQVNFTSKREERVILPSQAASSNVMRQLQGVTSSGN